MSVIFRNEKSPRLGVLGYNSSRAGVSTAATMQRANKTITGHFRPLLYLGYGKVIASLPDWQAHCRLCC